MASNNPEAEEVYRVNKLLQIEELAWSKQLEKAVSGSFYLNSHHPFPILFIPYIWLGAHCVLLGF